MSASEYAWDVFLPGQDLPLRIATDYVIGAGELLSVEGRNYLVERVETPTDDTPEVVPLVRVTEPQEPIV